MTMISLIRKTRMILNTSMLDDDMTQKNRPKIVDRRFAQQQSHLQGKRRPKKFKFTPQPNLLIDSNKIPTNNKFMMSAQHTSHFAHKHNKDKKISIPLHTIRTICEFFAHVAHETHTAKRKTKIRNTATSRKSQSNEAIFVQTDIYP